MAVQKLVISHVLSAEPGCLPNIQTGLQSSVIC